MKQIYDFEKMEPPTIDVKRLSSEMDEKGFTRRIKKLQIALTVVTALLVFSVVSTGFIKVSADEQRVETLFDDYVGGWFLGEDVSYATGWVFEKYCDNIPGVYVLKKTSDVAGKVLTEYILCRPDATYSVEMKMSDKSATEAPETNLICTKVSDEPDDEWGMSYFSCIADKECDLRVFTGDVEETYVLDETEENINVYGRENIEFGFGQANSVSVRLTISTTVESICTYRVEFSNGYTEGTRGDGTEENPHWSGEVDVYASYREKGEEPETLKLILKDIDGNVLLEQELMDMWEEGTIYCWDLDVSYDKNGKLVLTKR